MLGEPLGAGGKEEEPLLATRTYNMEGKH
jgi:hypothetical protein